MLQSMWARNEEAHSTSAGPLAPAYTIDPDAAYARYPWWVLKQYHAGNLSMDEVRFAVSKGVLSTRDLKAQDAAML